MKENAKLNIQQLSETLRAPTSDKKFLQTKFTPITNLQVEEAINSPKFLLDRTLLAPKLADFDFSTDSRSQHHSFTADYDMCETDVRFYLSLNANKDLDVHAFHTYKSSHDTFSISHYLLPGGSMENAVFIARVCSHGKNGQVHINWNGEIMPANESHVHIVTEYFQSLEKSNANGNEAHVASRMAYADAIAIPKLENIAVCAQFATDFFHIAPSDFSLSVQQFQGKKAEEWKKEVAELDALYRENFSLSNPVVLPTLNPDKLFAKTPKERPEKVM